jgi:hypothetical protein
MMMTMMMMMMMMMIMTRMATSLQDRHDDDNDDDDGCRRCGEQINGQETGAAATCLNIHRTFRTTACLCFPVPACFRKMSSNAPFRRKTVADVSCTCSRERGSGVST